MKTRWQLGAGTAWCVLSLVGGSGASTTAARPSLGIDQPSESNVVSGMLHAVGWGIDPTRIDADPPRIAVYLNGAYVKDATTGLPRNDLITASRLSGWAVDLDLDALLSPGGHVLEARMSTASGEQLSAVRTFIAAESRRFCVNGHFLRGDQSALIADLDRIKTAGVRGVRFDVNWDTLQPTQHAWDQDALARLDAVVDQIAVRGLRAVLVVLRTPAWARHGAGSAMTPPDNPSDFGQALQALAQRYAARSGVAWEVWNEPNDAHFWDSPGGPDPAAYTRLLQAAYAGIKAGSPWATVLGGSIAFNDTPFLQGMYAAGAHGSFDALAIHPYSLGRAPGDKSDPLHSFVLALDDMPRTLADNGDSGKPIWATEMGWSMLDVSDARRADYFREAVELVWPRQQVAVFCAFGLNQSSDSKPEYGLVGADGAATDSWLAYTRALAEH